MSLETIKLEPQRRAKVKDEIENAIAIAKEKNCQVNIEINKYEFQLTPNSNAE